MSAEQRRAFNFNEQDLEANRAGQLTPPQRTMLAQQSRLSGCASRVAALAFFASALALVLVPLLSGDASALQALPALIATALLFLLIAGWFLWLGWRRSADLRGQRLSVAQGPARRESRYITRLRMTAYYATIGGVRFQLPTQAQFNSLQEQQAYRVYYVNYPPAHLLLSIEPLTG